MYCIEADASHPLAAAIVSAAKAENISAPLSWTIENHQNLEGEGVTASINSQTVHVGNFRLFERLNYIKDAPANTTTTNTTNTNYCYHFYCCY